METLTALLLALAIATLYNGYRTRSMASQTLALANFGLFTVMWLADIAADIPASQTHIELGFRPRYLAEPGFGLGTLFTAMFVHGGFMHLLGNMLILMLMGVPFEERVGARAFIWIYLLSGLAGSLVTGVLALWQGDGEVYHIGASGAIFGIMGGFALLYPRDEIPMLLGPIFLHRVPVVLAALVFALGETAFVMFGVIDGVGHITHIASFGAGVFLAPLLTRATAPPPPPDLSALARLARPGAGAEALAQAQAADEPELREAWLETFWERVRCPACGGHLAPPGRCRDCGKSS